MHLLRIDASINGQRSASRELSDTVESTWRAEHPDSEVLTRDLHAEPVPPHAFADAVTAGFTPTEDRSPGQLEAATLAASYVDDLTSADAVLIGSPLYNFGISQHLKAWVDLVHTDPRSAGGSLPILQGVPVVLVSTRGGSYGEGTPRAGWDHATGFMTKVLGELWGADLTVIERELTMAGVNPAMDRFLDEAARLHESAREAARSTGVRIARRAAAVTAA